VDFLGHNVMRHFRDLARSQAVPVVACRRSSVCVAELGTALVVAY